MSKERRTYITELRAQDKDGKQMVRGYAAVFNSNSEDLGGFIERIDPKFFNGVLDQDVRALYNHKEDFVLGRTTSGTLQIGVDDKGLWYEYEDPDTTFSRDLLKSMKRGDVSQSSFGFTVAEDSWEERGGKTYRTLLKAERLFDVSPVSFPAYPDTSVAMRKLNEIKTTEQKELIDEDKKQRQIELDKIERLIEINKLNNE